MLFLPWNVHTVLACYTKMLFGWLLSHSPILAMVNSLQGKLSATINYSFFLSYKVYSLYHIGYMIWPIWYRRFHMISCDFAEICKKLLYFKSSDILPFTWRFDSNCFNCRSSQVRFSTVANFFYTSFSETLLVAPDEKRIMASVEKTRAMQIRRNSAAKIIQAAWRLYHFKCKKHFQEIIYQSWYSSYIF